MILTIFIVSNIIWFLLWLDLRIRCRKLIDHMMKNALEDLNDAIEQDKRNEEIRKQIEIVRSILTKKSA